MTIIKSFSVGNGDCFYINHSTSNFTIIDCCENNEENFSRIIAEIKRESKEKDIVRFISTHPDQDHISGIEKLFNSVSIPNFYCVENKATKRDSFPDFDFYCSLRDGNKHYYIRKGCRRIWLNLEDEHKENGSSGINVLWPDTDDTFFKDALRLTENGEESNNISPIIQYSLQDGVTAIWFGDMEHDFLENVYEKIKWPKKVDILFAPHHGRDSGKIPEYILHKINPKLIIIGEAPSEHLNYYCKWNTITQNTAGDITFYCTVHKVFICVSNESYAERCNILEKEPDVKEILGDEYIGSLNVED